VTSAATEMLNYQQMEEDLGVVSMILWGHNT
jgi:hypothetical protein